LQWLEQNTDDVQRWQREQSHRTDEQTEAWPALPLVRDLIARYTVPTGVALPRGAAGTWFRLESSTRVVISDEPYGPGRLLLQLADPEVATWLSPSPDGTILAVGVCSDGSERNQVRLVDVATGQSRDDAPTAVLNDSWAGGASWLPDSSGFWITVLASTEDEFCQEVHLHRLGRGGSTEKVDLPLPGPGESTVVQVSPDGRWAVAAHGINRTSPVAEHHLTEPSGSWRPFVPRTTRTVAGHPVGDAYIAVTDEGAPRGRLVRIPFDAERPEDPSTWEELRPQTETVLRSVTAVAGHLYLWELNDTYSRLTVLTEQGQPAGSVALPGRGTVHQPLFPLLCLVPRGGPDSLLFAFSTPTVSPGVYRHRPGASAVEELAPPQQRLDATVEDAVAVSADGTPVPYRLVRPTHVPPGPRPTLIYGYGGYDVPLLPQWAQGSSAFVAAGGVRVLAHLRGGGELGRDWWEGGRYQNKENSYADLFAIAESLVEQGVATPASLAVQGGSNGGLMAAVAVTRRPDLWAAAVCQVPLTDLLSALREPYTRMAIAVEMADPDDPADVERLLRFSPYHLVREGTVYPAVLVEGGGTDPRCPPWHARKLAARLQQAQAGSAPVLLRIWEGDGHGWATDEDLALRQQALRLSFLMRHTGLDPQPVPLSGNPA
jgi:prolyl oligopeptidase